MRYNMAVSASQIGMKWLRYHGTQYIYVTDSRDGLTGWRRGNYYDVVRMQDPGRLPL